MSRPARPDEPDLADLSIKAARRRDAAFLLPILGVFLFLSPLVAVAAKAGTIFGVPGLIAFVFGSWILLIVLTWRLARRLTDEPGF